MPTEIGVNPHVDQQLPESIAANWMRIETVPHVPQTARSGVPQGVGWLVPNDRHMRLLCRCQIGGQPFVHGSARIPADSVGPFVLPRPAFSYAYLPILAR